MIIRGVLLYKVMVSPYQQVVVNQTPTLGMVTLMENIQKEHPAPDTHSQIPETNLNIMAAFATVQWRYLITAITVVKSAVHLIIYLRAPGMHHTHLQLGQQVNHTITMVLSIGEPYSQSA